MAGYGMAELPTGTVTFLFTDIEGSTVLWEQHPDDARTALVRHDQLVEQVVAEHDGHVVRPRGEGDSRFAVFARATDAVAAAASLQQALYAEPWPTPTPLRVRMAIHTGEADLREGDYYGTAVNRCARLRSVAHGGQTLVSLATQELARDSLPMGMFLEDLGAHRLKDLVRPEQVFQLVMPSLRADFPPLKSLDAQPHNLPLQRDALIGREREVEAVVTLLRRPSTGFVTLTGPGGTGKTRLSQQVAAELLDDFADGAWFVDLSPIADPALVASTIVQTLGLQNTAERPASQLLKASLRDKQQLLVLDNFEQLLPAAPLLTEMLSAAPALKILVTSREILHIYGEQEYAVLPLALPDLSRLHMLDRLTQYAAVALFIQRAQAVKPDFQVTNDNAPAVAEICVRLDGLPLALELAAARIKLFPPQALLTRLENRLKLLTGGGRDRTARQQTLRGTIDWSYDLLDEATRGLFVRLGIFVGGFTLEAAEAICNSEGDIDMVDAVASLVDKSLVRPQVGTDGEPRFTMLETIREYALDQLAASGDAAVARKRFVAFFLALAEATEPQLNGAEQLIGQRRLEAEHDNLRAALRESRTLQDDAEVELRLSIALATFWSLSHVGEGRQWLETAIERGHRAPPALLARAFREAGALAWQQSDYAVAYARFRDSVALFRRLGDQRQVAEGLNGLVITTVMQGDLAAARAASEESLAFYEVAGNEASLAKAYLLRGFVALYAGEYEAARPMSEEALRRWRLVGNLDAITMVLTNLGIAAVQLGDYARGTALLQEGLQVAQEAESDLGSAWPLRELGAVALAQGDHIAARGMLRQSLLMFQEQGHRRDVVICLEGLAGVSAAQGLAERAARVLGAADRQREILGTPLLPPEEVSYTRAVEAVRAQLDDETFAAAREQGRAMTLEQAVAYALSDET